jgi:hypothetical protein
MEALSISRRAWAGLIGVSAVFLAVTFVSRLDGQGIRIEGDSWNDYTVATEMPADADSLCASLTEPGSPYTIVCQTSDGVAFAALRGRCPTLTYNLEVTSLPAGKTRFPVLLSLRRVGDPGSGLLNVHNETTASVLSFSLDFNQATARFVDNTGADETLPSDPPELPAGGLFDSVDPGAGGRAPSEIASQLAMIELVEGQNVIRFDSCVPFSDGDHAQVFTFWIGPSDQDLAGFVSGGCAVGRKIEPRTYAAGDQLTVTLTLTRVTAGTTATETIPVGMSVADAGGGTVSGAEIKFTPPAGDSTVTYVLDTGDLCGASSISGTYSGPGGCEGTTSGDGVVNCVGEAGIRIEGEDFLNLASSEPPLDPDPCLGNIQICTTLDGVDFLKPNTSPVRLFDIVYRVTVEALPGGVDQLRVPVALRARRNYTGNGKIGIRNASTVSWIGFRISGGAGDAACDSGAGEVISGTSYTPSPTDSTDPAQGGVPPNLVRSSGADLSLALGTNEIHIENFGPGGPGDSDGDNPQVFLIAFGPDETELAGGLCISTEANEETCDDGVDNDCDGLTDAEDSDCACVKTEEKEATCNDSLDNDCDGFTDAEDSDCVPPKPIFHRGDPNDDGTINITDGIYVLNFLFLGGPAPTCREAANPNDDDTVNITDGIYLLNFLFLGGPPPAAPGGMSSPCGEDPATSPSDLGCASYTKC